MPALVLFTSDPAVAPSLQAIAQEAGARLVVHRAVHDPDLEEPPLAAVVDLELDGALGAAGAWRARWPDALTAAFISYPDRALWDRALAAGFDLVATRGAIARQLAKTLASWRGRSRARRVRLFDADDVAGRIGVVHRLVDEEVGPIAVYHVGSELFAATDTCPHAGGQLSRGALDRDVVTCPEHGSQFEIRTGARLRGPADDPIRTFPVIVEGGIAYLEVG